MVTPISKVNEKYEFDGTGSFQTDQIDIIPNVSSKSQVVINKFEIRFLAIDVNNTNMPWNSMLINMEMSLANVTYPGMRIQSLRPVTLDSKFQSDRVADGNGKFCQLMNNSGDLGFNVDQNMYFRDRGLNVTQRPFEIDASVSVNGMPMTDFSDIPSVKRSFTLVEPQSFSFRITHNAPSGCRLIFYVLVDGMIIELS